MGFSTVSRTAGLQRQTGRANVHVHLSGSQAPTTHTVPDRAQDAGTCAGSGCRAGSDAATLWG